MEAGPAPYATASPTASGMGLAKTTGSSHQNHRLQVAATSTATSPSGAAPQLPARCHQGWWQRAVRLAFKHVPRGKCHMAWLLRDAEDSCCPGGVTPRCCSTQWCSVHHINHHCHQGRSKMHLSASAANEPPDPRRHSWQQTSLPCRDSCGSSCPATRVFGCWTPPAPPGEMGLAGRGSTPCAATDPPFPPPLQRRAAGEGTRALCGRWQPARAASQPNTLLRLSHAWQAASLKEVINSQAPAQDKHL